MKRLLTVAMLLLTCVTFAQTNISIGGGVLEQGRVLGIGFAYNGEVNQEITRNFGITAGYTGALLQTGNSVLLVQTGDGFDKLEQAPDGTEFHQVHLLGNYKFYTNDEHTAFRINAGAVWQQDGEYHPAAGLDIIAFPKSPLHAYLSWLPVFRGAWGEGDGWSHTVTLNIAVRL